MKPKEIRETGILELYVLGLLSEEEKSTVLTALKEHPELQKDLAEIESALELYGQSTAVEAPKEIKETILEELRNRNPPAESGSQGSKNDGSSPAASGQGWKIFRVLIGLAMAFAIYVIYKANQRLEQSKIDLELRLDSCETANTRLNARIDLLEHLVAPGNNIFRITATPAYASTDLYFHHNPLDQRNFIQVINLPAIQNNQSYQLWSLKPDTAPIPLDVFEDDRPTVFEVAYEDGTQTYAITIEPRGGGQTPTLENLIGTVGVLGD